MSDHALQRPPWGFVAGRTLVAGLLAWAMTMVALMLASLLGPGGALASRVFGTYGSWPPFDGASVTAFAANAGAVVILAVVVAVALWLATGAKGTPVPLLWTAAAGILAAVASLPAGLLVMLVVAALVLRQVGYRGDGSPRAAPVSDRPMAIALATLTVLAVAAVAVRSAEVPLVLNAAGGTSVSAVPAFQLLDLREQDRGVPRPRLAQVSLRNLGPRDVRVQGVRASRHAGGVRVLGARTQVDWRPGQPALPVMAPYTLPPGEYGDLTVLVSDPHCKQRRKPLPLPLDVRTSGGMSRLTISLPRCR